VLVDMRDQATGNELQRAAAGGPRVEEAPSDELAALDHAGALPLIAALNTLAISACRAR
jgi:hypothetical protein